MIKRILIPVILFVTLSANSQVIINVQSGLSVSRQDFVYNSSMVGYSEFVGIEYLDQRIYNEIFMNLNSNIGFIRKGGNFKEPEASIMYSNLGFNEEGMHLNYFSLNSTADFKYPFNKDYIPFIGIGPFLEILMSHNDISKQFYEIENPQKLSYGILLNLGLKYSYDQFQFGLKWDYFFNFNKISNWLGKDINARTFTISIIAGYKIK